MINHTTPSRKAVRLGMMVLLWASPIWVAANPPSPQVDHPQRQEALLREDRERLAVVKEFADHVLEHGRDRYRANPTPLFADGINVETGAHVQWILPGNKGVVISDLACQQNLFRTLTALSNLTGDPQYKDAAKAAIRYHFDKLADPGGLLQWGGHRFIDLETLKPSGPAAKGMVHELKNALPYYDLMYEVNPAATVKYIKAFWNAHVLDWNDLYVGRHGKYGLPLGDVWAHPLVNLPPLRESIGLSFINAGDDLIYAAGTLYRLTGDEGALRWSKHLAYQYVAARHPKTGLGAYQFTQRKKEKELTDDNDTGEKGGDRARRQFGPEFGAVALEGNILFAGAAGAIYGENALMQMQLAAENDKAASDLLEWTQRGLLSFARYAYIPEQNLLKPMFTDGADLTGYVFKRNGYYGPAGTELKRYRANCKYLLSYARGFLYTHDLILWQTARSIAKGNDLGELGSAPGKNVQVNLATQSANADALFAILDLYRATGTEEYLNLARKIGNNIVRTYYHHGYFTKGRNYLNAQFDMVEPLALLALAATIQGKADQVPPYMAGNGFINGDYQYPDGKVKDTYDDYIYSIRR